MNLKPRLSAGGTAKATERGWLLSIPSGSNRQYRLSQLDDHRGLARIKYPCRPPLELSLDARVSSPNLPGTWGFGMWNDPYGFSFGPSDGFWRFPALPNAAWYFYSSPISYLSFRDDKPANGFLAQVFASPLFDPLLLQAIATLPFSLKKTRSLLSRIISEDGVSLYGLQAPPDPRRSKPDVTQWHHYVLDWDSARTRFIIDDVCILETQLTPHAPLGIVIWIDNQHAGFNPQGKLTFGLEPNPEPAWMEIGDLDLE
jgi:hypothetical protein